MKSKAAILGLGGIVLAAVGFFVVRSWMDRQELATRVESLVREADAELAKEPQDRDALASLVRQLESMAVSAPDRQLQLQRARIEHALGRAKAWDTVAELALASDADLATLELAAEITASGFAISGRRDQAGTCLNLIERHTAQQPKPGLLLLGWRIAEASARPQESANYAQMLASQFADSPEAKLLALLADFEPSNPEHQSAVSSMLRLFSQAPIELRTAAAAVEIAGEDADRIDRALADIEAWLPANAYNLQLRNTAAVGYHKRGVQDRRDHQLRWLLEHAPSDDSRRPTWSGLLDTVIR